MRARLPKPPDRRQRQNARPQVLALRPRRSLAEVPSAPAEWLALTRERWMAYWQSDVARLVDLSTDAIALVRLFTLYDERERAYRAYRKKRLVLGRQGQPVVNPLWKAAAVMDTEIRQLEDRFGVSPQARLRLGVQLGDAVRSLEDMNRELGDEDTAADGDDPRLEVVRTDGNRDGVA